MSDILERLKTIPRSTLPIGAAWKACEDAAAEIERLRASADMGISKDLSARVPQLKPWREELSEIIGHLSSAIVQSCDKDDRIIMDHVKAAYEIAKVVKRKA